MTKPRIYHPHDMEEGVVYNLGRNHLHYLKRVLRTNVGNTLILFDGSGNEYDGIVRQLSDRNVRVEIVKKTLCAEEDLHDVTLLQALPKGSKMDLIVQKTTELGVGKIIPFVSERSVPKMSPAKGIERVARWQTIALEATRQSGRVSAPEIGEIHSFREVIRSAGGAKVRIIFWEEETRTSLRELIENGEVGQAKDLAIVIGPEGGFSRDEVMEAREAGYKSASIGTKILKVDTAAIATLTIIQYTRGFFDSKKREGGPQNGL